MDKIEIRQISNAEIVADENRNVEGYALVFDAPSDGLEWVETIHAGAITDETIGKSDVFAKLNHNDNAVLARSKFGKGSLVLEVNGKGLKYLFEAPNTATGNELLEFLKRGDITASSFAFSIDKNDPTAEKWHRDTDGRLYRDIYKIARLYDVSPVFQPAFSATSVNVSKRFAEVKAQADELAKIYEEKRKEINKLFPFE